jgi:hypothetical protein
MPELDVNNPDDRKKIADALVTVLNAGVDLSDADLDGANPFGDIGPSPALDNLKRERPSITQEEVAGLSQALYASAANVNKFTNIVKTVKGAIGLIKGAVV